MIDYEALFKVSYGLYIVCSGDENKGNGFISNAVFQVTAEPARFSACCNKDNYTAELMKKTGAFSVSVLETKAKPQLFGTFGYKSGRDIDKMQGLNVKYGETGVPMILDSSVAIMEFKIVETYDVGTHLMFIGELLSSELLDNSKDPMTYKYYREVKKGRTPKNAVTYVAKK
jgi:flavin reductase (DIM6/NTAB) family NADH-FMN oxidoreductase RutF